MEQQQLGQHVSAAVELAINRIDLGTVHGPKHRPIVPRVVLLLPPSNGNALAGNHGIELRFGELPVTHFPIQRKQIKKNEQHDEKMVTKGISG